MGRNQQQRPGLLRVNIYIYIYIFGFENDKSTHTVLIALLNKTFEALDEYALVVSILPDFCKFFNTVDHGIFLQNPELYSVQDIRLKSFDSCLCTCICAMQYVTFDSSVVLINFEPTVVINTH